MPEKEMIYLTFVLDESGRKYVVDQHGREVAHVLGVSSHSAINECDTITINVYDHKSDGTMKMQGGG